MLQILCYLWAAPWTAVGGCLGLVGLATGGCGFCRQGILEFCGGWLPWLLQRAPICGGASAVTLGHVVLARTPRDLEWTRDHERVHVSQYERWGPLFVPAYLLVSGLIWLRGGDPYLDNPFERQAYGDGHAV